MSPSSPFVDPGTGSIALERVVAEAIPVAKLIGLFVGVALVPLGLGFLLGGASPLGALLTLVAQFVLAIGSAVVLMHVVVRGVRLAERSPDTR